jgi:L-threonylcarbamoyladenylate synthase
VNVPVAAPSANRFGHTSPTTAKHVLDDLCGQVDLIIDGGPTTIGVESTVLDVTRNPPMILRPGGVSRETLERHIGPVILLTASHRKS